MEVEIQTKDQSQPIRHTGVRNTYIEGPMYCIMFNDFVVDKFPVDNLFRVRERPGL